MNINEAVWDRGLRVVLGLALLSLTVTGPHTLWGLSGIVVLATGVRGFCPVYWLTGLSTCAIQPKESHGLGLNR